MTDSVRRAVGSIHDWRLPRISWRAASVWQRNFQVWKRYLFERLIGNVVDPLITLVAFGYGLGKFMPHIEGLPYLLFLASGTVCMSTMFSANFESLWGAFSRMHVQRTWDAILNAPLAVDDVLVGELLWSASKSAFTGTCILAVIGVLGISREPLSLCAIPLLLFIGATFSALALLCNALARGFDFFTYYFTLVVSPMGFLSGIFFPLSALPPWLQHVAGILPLTAAVALVRPLVLGELPKAASTSIAILACYLSLALYLATVLTRRRLQS